jgi:hypothetical protein
MHIAARPPESSSFQTNRGTIEKRSDRWLKEVASRSQTTGFDLNAWIPAWEAVAQVVRSRGGIKRHFLPSE